MCLIDFNESISSSGFFNGAYSFGITWTLVQPVLHFSPVCVYVCRLVFFVQKKRILRVLPSASAQLKSKLNFSSSSWSFLSNLLLHFGTLTDMKLLFISCVISSYGGSALGRGHDEWRHRGQTHSFIALSVIILLPIYRYNSEIRYVSKFSFIISIGLSGLSALSSPSWGNNERECVIESNRSINRATNVSILPTDLNGIENRRKFSFVD